MAGKRIIVFALFALVAVAFALSARGGAEAQTFKPVNGYSLSSSTPGANANSTAFTGIAAPDFNLEDASSINLNPVDGASANGLEAPIGAVVGTLNANAAVGLLGGPCNSALTPGFTLKNSSVDIAVELADTSWILKEAATVPVPLDPDGSGRYTYETKYPWFLNDMLDPDGAGAQLPIQPRARFAGHTTVAGFNVIVQFLVFNPGQMAAAGGIFAQLTADKGSPSLIVLDNPIGEGSSTPGAIADFCTPLTTTTTLNGVTTDNGSTGAVNEAGFTRQANAAINRGVLGSGTQMALYYVQSERNIDGDNFENDFDACRYTADLATWNPRVGPAPACLPGSQPGDQDCDMLPSSCDPNDAVGNGDQDGDGYDNAQDNCPLVANGCQDSACGPTWNAAWTNQEDTDGGLTNTDLGPRTDALGDSCDDSDDDGNEDGGAAGDCNDGIDNGGGDAIDGADADCTAAMDAVDTPTAGNPANPQNGTYYHGMPWAAEWVGTAGGAGAEAGCAAGDTVDDDSDGFVNDGCAADGPPETGGQCAYAVNDDADTLVNDGCPAVQAGDADGDGFSQALETLLGSSDADGADATCGDAADDGDGDLLVNDGCPRVGKYSETGAECLNALNDDAARDPAETVATINDGCPLIGTPESLVIDASVTAAAALPTATAAQSCTDGLDNDDDGAVDTDNEVLGCNPAHISYASDTDRDGVQNGNDNCPANWNPTQTNTDAGVAAQPPIFPAGDTLGDACDTDDDADDYTDVFEAYFPTDPLDRCRNTQTQPGGTFASDTWGLDQNSDRFVTVAGDVAKYTGKLGQRVSTVPPGTWANARLDLNKDDFVTVAGDVAKYTGKLGQSCT